MAGADSTAELSLLELARLHEEQGYYQNALEIYERILKVRPERQDVRRGVSRVRRALLLQERRSGTRRAHPLELAEAHALAGNPEAAREILAGLQRVRPGDPLASRLPRWLDLLAEGGTPDEASPGVVVRGDGSAPDLFDAGASPLDVPSSSPAGPCPDPRCDPSVPSAWINPRRRRTR